MFSLNFFFFFWSFLKFVVSVNKQLLLSYYYFDLLSSILLFIYTVLAISRFKWASPDSRLSECFLVDYGDWGGWEEKGLGNENGMRDDDGMGTTEKNLSADSAGICVRPGVSRLHDFAEHPVLSELRRHCGWGTKSGARYNAYLTRTAPYRPPRTTQTRCHISLRLRVTHVSDRSFRVTPRSISPGSVHRLRK